MFGQRLKEERKRVGFTQPRLGEIVSLTKRTVIDWEKDKSSPTAIQLAAMAKHGFDVSYLITGIRTQPVELPSDEALLLEIFRALDIEEKTMALKFLIGGLESLQVDKNANADSTIENPNSNNTDSVIDSPNSNNTDSAIDSPNSNNTNSVIGSPNSNNTNSVIGSPNSNNHNSFNTQSGFTEIPFLIGCIVCGSMAWLLAAVATYKMETDALLSNSFGSMAILLWVMAMVMAGFGYSIGKKKFDEVQAGKRLAV